MKSSTQDKAEGKWRQGKDKTNQVAGKAVGNRDLEVEGKGGKSEGKVQEKLGQIKKLTWDCACLGSSFDRYGAVISGPAKSDLEKYARITIIPISMKTQGII
jgi:uncharacterized protein YjbJ (UPF0337 family)